MDKKDLSQADWDALVYCQKQVVGKLQTTLKREGKYECGEFRLASSDGENQYVVFMRQNSVLREEFSIGLRYTPPGGRHQVLLRCNGKHGITHRNLTGDAAPIKHKNHIHRVKHEEIQAGGSTDHYAEVTSDYETFDEAIGHFLRLTNVLDVERVLPTQMVMRELSVPPDKSE